MPRRKTDRMPKPAPSGTKAQIAYVPVGDIHLWEENPRKNDEAVPRLAALLAKHGFRTPLVVWDENRVIYKGNTTYKAAIEVGFTEVPVIFHHFASETEAIAYALSDNKASEWTEWDDEVLTRLMQQEEMVAELQPENTGFTEGELMSYQLSTDVLPDELPDVDLEGIQPQKSDFLIIRFKNAEDRAYVRGILGLVNERQRTIDYTRFAKHVTWREQADES